MSLVKSSLLILFMAVLLTGCSTLKISPDKRVMPLAVPGETGLTYSISTSAPLIQISGGNLHWHKKMPNIKYTLEDVVVEIYNFGDSDIMVSQLEIKVDGNSKLFDTDMVVSGKTRKNVAVRPMMENYDGGTHIVRISLLDEKGRPLYQRNEEEVGPLEPLPETGSWQPAQT